MAVAHQVPPPAATPQRLPVDWFPLLRQFRPVSRSRAKREPPPRSHLLQPHGEWPLVSWRQGSRMHDRWQRQGEPMKGRRGKAVANCGIVRWEVCPAMSLPRHCRHGLPVHVRAAGVDVREIVVAADTALEQAAVAEVAGGCGHEVGGDGEFDIHGDVGLVP